MSKEVAARGRLSAHVYRRNCLESFCNSGSNSSKECLLADIGDFLGSGVILRIDICWRTRVFKDQADYRLFCDDGQAN